MDRAGDTSQCRYCPCCGGVDTYLRATRPRKDGSRAQRFLCRTCGRQFNERTGTPLGRLRQAGSILDQARQLHAQGLGFRAIGRLLGVHHNTVARWLARYSAADEGWTQP